MPRLISDRFEDRSTGIIHFGEANDRDARSEWPWLRCGKAATFMHAVDKPVTCMHCIAGIPLWDWKTQT
jgi:hypothetical protein